MLGQGRDKERARETLIISETRAFYMCPISFAATANPSQFSIEQDALDTNGGKQLSSTATDV